MKSIPNRRRWWRTWDYAERKLRAILWKISPEEQEGMCQRVLSPITEKSEIQRSLFKQIIVTIRMKCFLDNDCSWCWACSNVQLTYLRDTEAHRSEMELLLEVTFPVYATSPPGGQLEQIPSWGFYAVFPPHSYKGWISSHSNLMSVFRGLHTKLLFSH